MNSSRSRAYRMRVEALEGRDVPALVFPVAYVEQAPSPPAVALPPAVPPYQPPPQTLVPDIFDPDQPEQLLPNVPNPPALTPQLPTGPDYTFPPSQYPIPGVAIPPPATPSYVPSGPYDPNDPLQKGAVPPVAPYAPPDAAAVLQNDATQKAYGPTVGPPPPVPYLPPPSLPG